MDTKNFKIYSVFAQLPVLKNSYAIKVMSIAMFGILMPLFVLICYLAINTSLNDNLNIIIVVFLATLVGMITSLSLLYLLMLPIHAISTGLQQYLNDGQKPHFPPGFRDSIGQLMTLIQYMIEKFDLLNNSLKFSNMVDPLTGIPNRRASKERLCQDMARIRREKKQMLIALLDVDQLKAINKSYGHNLGDVCLTQIVETLFKNIREGDWIARWDDNQFLMVLWDFDSTVPTTVLERIQRQSIKTHPLEQLLHLELSIGACIYKGDKDTESHLETILTCLNKALFQVKQTGEGGIVLTEELL